MTQADLIRQFAHDHFVALARGEGRSEITIRAGDVHQAMGLANAMPAVCSAIGSDKFEELAHVRRIQRIGPDAGSNVYYRFTLSVRPLSEPQTAHPRKPDHKSVPPRVRRDLDLSGAIVLVSCVKSKLPSAAPARELYTSAWFRKVRDIVEAKGAPWFILSALYGLVTPDAKIAPYHYTLNSLGVAERRKWANKVLAKLLPEIANERRIVMFAGHRYREFLVEPLRRHGITVDVPMANLTRGEQLAWLSETE